MAVPMKEKKRFLFSIIRHAGRGLVRIWILFRVVQSGGDWALGE